MPGAPGVPQQHQPPPPPPAAAPAPEPAAPAHAYAPPADLSGFFGGSVAPAAPPSQFSGFGAQPSQFGGPPSQFGAPPSQFGGPAPVYGGFGPPGVGLPSVDRRGIAKTPRWVVPVLVVVGLLVAIGLAPRALDLLHAHHVNTLPATAGQLSESQDPALAAKLSQVKATASTGYFHTLKNLQLAVYFSDNQAYVVEVGELSAGSEKHADEWFQGVSGSLGAGDMSATGNTSGFGGSVECGTASLQNSGVCSWIDDGTFGLVMSIGQDQTVALTGLQQIRAAVEH